MVPIVTILKPGAPHAPTPAPTPAPTTAPIPQEKAQVPPENRNEGKICADVSTATYTSVRDSDCNGWSGLSEAQCWDKCASNAQAPNCPAGFCAAMRYLPKTEGCHLQNSCTQLKNSFAMVPIVTILK